jgi:hypothetical protein
MKPGRCQKRLAALVGIGVEDFCARYGWVNLLGRWPGRKGAGDGWEPSIARANAAGIRGALSAKKTPTIVIMLGYKVSEAFGIGGSYFLGSVERPYRGQEVMFVVFPHPSGISRWWNVPENRKKAAEVLRRWAT